MLCLFSCVALPRCSLLLPRAAVLLCCPAVLPCSTRALLALLCFSALSPCSCCACSCCFTSFAVGCMFPFFGCTSPLPPYLPLSCYPLLLPCLVGASLYACFLPLGAVLVLPLASLPAPVGWGGRCLLLPAGPLTPSSLPARRRCPRLPLLAAGQLPPSARCGLLHLPLATCGPPPPGACQILDLLLSRTALDWP